MDNVLSEEPEIVHKAIITCIRRCTNHEDRKCFLLILEQMIAQKSGNSYHSEIYSVVSGSGADFILKSIFDEIQALKMGEMEKQVDILIDTPPVQETPISDINNFSEANYINLRALKISDSSSESDQGDIFDLTELINDDMKKSSDLFNHDQNIIQTVDYDKNNPLLNSNILPPNGIPNIAPDNNFAADIKGISDINFSSIDPPFDINSVLPNGNIPSTIDTNHFLLNNDDLTPDSDGQSFGIPNFVLDDDLLSDNNMVSESNVELNFTFDMDETLNDNSVPLIPGNNMSYQMIRPQGHLPPPIPISTRKPSDNRPPQILSNMGPPTSTITRMPLMQADIVANSVPGSDVKSRISAPISRQNSTEHKVPFSKQNGIDYRTPMSRQNSLSSQSHNNDIHSKKQSGSSTDDNELPAPIKSDLQCGDTVYDHKRVSLAQLETFITNGDVKGQLKDLGAFYSITPCSDTNYFVISLSGKKDVVKKGMVILDKEIPKGDIVYTTEHLSIANHRELKPSGYVYKLLKQIYPSCEIRCKVEGKSLDYSITGKSDKVFQLVMLIKFMITLPAKKFGILYKLHPLLTSSPELMERLCNTACQITNQHVDDVQILDCSKSEPCIFLFVPGLFGQDYHAKLQRHLNILVEKLTNSSRSYSASDEQQEEEKPEESDNKIVIKYTVEDMLRIRQFCTTPLPALVQSNLPIKHIL